MVPKMIDLGIDVKLRGFILWTILLISLCFSSAAKAFTSQVFNSFRNNEYSTLEGVSAHLIKSYVQGSYGALAKQCPNISVPTIPDQLETARYMMMPHRQGDVGAGFFPLERS